MILQEGNLGWEYEREVGDISNGSHGKKSILVKIEHMKERNIAAAN